MADDPADDVKDSEQDAQVDLFLLVEEYDEEKEEHRWYGQCIGGGADDVLDNEEHHWHSDMNFVRSDGAARVGGLRQELDNASDTWDCKFWHQCGWQDWSEDVLISDANDFCSRSDLHVESESDLWLSADDSDYGCPGDGNNLYKDFDKYGDGTVKDERGNLYASEGDGDDSIDAYDDGANAYGDVDKLPNEYSDSGSGLVDNCI